VDAGSQRSIVSDQLSSMRAEVEARHDLASER
jgi:hypothetical protein